MANPPTPQLSADSILHRFRAGTQAGEFQVFPAKPAQIQLQMPELLVATEGTLPTARRIAHDMAERCDVPRLQERLDSPKWYEPQGPRLARMQRIVGNIALAVAYRPDLADISAWLSQARNRRQLGMRV